MSSTIVESTPETRARWTIESAAAAPTSWDHKMHVHGPNEVTDGFVATVTHQADGKTWRQDVAVYTERGAASYMDALTHVKALREDVRRGVYGPTAVYALPDTLYTCGCRCR